MDGIGQALEREFPRDQPRLGDQHAAAAGGVRRSAGAAGVRAACRHGRDRAAHRLRQHREPAARARRWRGAASWRCGSRSAPAAGASSGSCSSSARCSPSCGAVLSLAVSRWTLTLLLVARVRRLAVGRQRRAQPARADAHAAGVAGRDAARRACPGARGAARRISWRAFATTAARRRPATRRTTRLLVAGAGRARGHACSSSPVWRRARSWRSSGSSPASTWTTC